MKQKYNEKIKKQLKVKTKKFENRGKKFKTLQQKCHSCSIMCQLCKQNTILPTGSSV